MPACLPNLILPSPIVQGKKTKQKNCKADELSCLYTSEEVSNHSEFILPLSLVVSLIKWTLDDRIIEAATTEPTLLGCPPNKLTYQHLMQIPLIKSILCCYWPPWVNFTFSPIQERFWWPKIRNNITRFIQGIEKCVKTPPIAKRQ